ncbi:HipA domain-containing protein [Rheinheimera sp. UJ51]|uniref:HipA domain-containing protein n=1 Tax=Rheinheimera sp. UJ51 TaxID=2892446 RepID=UPI00226FA4CA|nr:HipA domain-containing protein [Rheinheimera sp. UJ51]MCC5452894.1 HipA domain-containing protein [Rheinheimera sp. UJ51]
MGYGSNTLPQLEIFAQHYVVGTLTFKQQQFCELHYSEHWLNVGYPISPHLPLSGDYSANTVVRFLRNLFPEGGAFDRLLETEHLSKNNIYSILRTIGSDTAGLLTFATQVADQDAPMLRQVTNDELAARLRQQQDMTYWDGKYRLSLAGVQNKLNVFLNDHDDIFLASGAYSSTHILKFASDKHPSIVINEFFCMQLAKAINLSCAKVSLRSLNEFTSLMIERFDRKKTSSGIKKRHIIDGCQALDMPPENKYEQNFGSSRDVQHIREGVSLPKLFVFANQTAIPAQTRLKLLDAVIFNLIIGNSDAHGKNFSFYIGKQEGISLAPLYDLVSVVYEAQQVPDLDTHLAMAIGDNFEIGNISAYDLLAFAEQVGIEHAYLKRRLNRLCQLVTTMVHKLDFTADPLSQEQLAHIEALKALFIKRAESLQSQAKLFEQVRREAF